MAISYHFDLYPADDPKDGTRLVRFTKLQSAEYRKDNGTGSIRIVISSNESEADFLDPAGLQYIRVVEDNGSTERVVGGGFLEKGRYEALDAQGTKRITWTGAGTLAYLDRFVMATHTYAGAAGALAGYGPGYQDPFDRIWRLGAQGFGATLGAMLWRVVSEALSYQAGAYSHEHGDGLDYTDTHADDRTATVIPAVTLGFSNTVDSDSNAWTVEDSDFKVSVGARGLDVSRRLMQAGLWIELDPDTFVLDAWEVANHGRDRTGVAWGTNVVRLQAPSDADDEASGNIKSASERTLVPMYRRTLMWAGGGDDTYVKATGTAPIPWEGFHPDDSNDTSILTSIAERAIVAGDDAGDAAKLFFDIADSPTTGRYLPFDQIDTDDLVTVHSGATQWDWNEAAYPVSAIVIRQREAGWWDAWAEVGSNYVSMESREFQDSLKQIIRQPGSHTHPPNPELCRPMQLNEPIFDDAGFVLSFGDGLPWTVPAELTEGALFVVTVRYFGVTSTPDWVRWTVGGTPYDFDQVEDIQVGSLGLTLWQLLDPVAGTGSVTNENGDHFGLWQVSSVDQADPIAATATNSGTSDSPNVSVAVPAGAVVYDAIGAFDAEVAGFTLNPAPGPGQSEDWAATWEQGGPGYAEGNFGGSHGGGGSRSWTIEHSDPWVALAFAVNGSGVSGGVSGDGHPDLVGASIRATRCDHRHDVHRAAAPTADDDSAAGYKLGTIWAQLDDLDTPTEIVAVWMAVDVSEGAAIWLPWPGGDVAASDVSYDNSTSGLTATDVQAGIDELEARVDTLEASALDDLSDVAITSPASGHRLRYNGSQWVNSSLKWVPLTVYDGTNYLPLVDGDGNQIMSEA